MLDIRPNGSSSSLTGFYLRDSSTAANGSNIVIVGRGNATLPSTGVTYLGALISGIPSANSLHLGFLVSNTSAGRIEAARIWNSGNVLIQAGGTYTDAGFRLDVNGTARTGTLRLSALTDTLEFTNTLVRIRRVSNRMAFDGFDGFEFVDSNASASRMRIFGTTGNVLIQNGGTFTDNGTRLRVVGTTQSDIITQNLASHGRKVLQYTSVSSTTINLPTEFPLMTGLVVANAYAVFGKFLGKYITYGQAIEFYISKNPNGTWNTVAYSDSSEFIASLVSVTGSGNDLTITTQTDASFILELTVMTQS
jgi:hypothetical protein